MFKAQINLVFLLYLDKGTLWSVRGTRHDFLCFGFPKINHKSFHWPSEEPDCNVMRVNAQSARKPVVSVALHFWEVGERWLGGYQGSLQSLFPRIKGSGGLLLTRRIEDLWELQPSFDIVVNCSGLGSRRLVGDPMISPVRGQVLQARAPWVKHFIRDGSGLTYIYPGMSYVTLGGTREKGDWNLSPDAELSREIFSRCCALEPSLYRAYDIKEKVGLRPSRPGVRLQKEILVRGQQTLPVVHNYGHGSGGISVHWGSALEATRLVMECIHTLRTPASLSKL